MWQSFVTGPWHAQKLRWNAHAQRWAARVWMNEWVRERSSSSKKRVSESEGERKSQRRRGTVRASRLNTYWCSANTADTDTTSRAAQKSPQKNNIGDETVVAPSSAAAAWKVELRATNAPSVEKRPFSKVIYFCSYFFLATEKEHEGKVTTQKGENTKKYT